MEALLIAQLLWHFFQQQQESTPRPGKHRAGTSPFPAQLCKMEPVSLQPSSLQREGGGGGEICTKEKQLQLQPCAEQSQG